MTSTIKSAVASTIAGLNATIAEIRGQQAALRKHRKAINRAFKPLHKAHAAGLLRYAPDMSISGKGTDWWVHNVTINVCTEDLDGFKDERLEKLLAHYVNDEYETKTADWPESLNRDFRFTKRLTPTFTLTVLICAYVKADSPTCRKVLKSTRTEVIERHEYEIVCS
jgi:hypothetical protein